MRELGLTVLVPMAAGQLLQFLATKQVQWLQSKVNFSKVGNLCILLLVWSTFCSTFANRDDDVDAGSVFVIIVVLELLLLAFALLCLAICTAPGARQLLDVDRTDAVAVAFVGATKTVALGIPLIGVLYGEDSKQGILSVPLLIYHASQILVGGLLVPSIRRWKEADPRPKAAAGAKALAEGEAGEQRGQGSTAAGDGAATAAAAAGAAAAAAAAAGADIEAHAAGAPRG
jgi:sodium/bile acid cotransporter 7